MTSPAGQAGPDAGPASYRPDRDARHRARRARVGDYLRRALHRDVIAGVSVAMVGVPQSLAYAELAGMPAIVGLYAGAIPPLLAALFASSPYLQTGPVAITSLLTFGALSGLATPASPEYVTLGLGLALIVGTVRVLLGLLRAGWLAYLMSQPMLIGFVPAAALLIAASQLAKAVGLSEPPFESDIVGAGWAVLQLPRWELAAVLMALATAALVVGGRRLHPLFPGVLVASVIGVGAFTSGVVVNVLLGFLLSAIVFSGFWSSL